MDVAHNLLMSCAKRSNHMRQYFLAHKNARDSDTVSSRGSKVPSDTTTAPEVRQLSLPAQLFRRQLNEQSAPQMTDTQTIPVTEPRAADTTSASRSPTPEALRAAWGDWTSVSSSCAAEAPPASPDEGTGTASVSANPMMTTGAPMQVAAPQLQEASMLLPTPASPSHEEAQPVNPEEERQATAAAIGDPIVLQLRRSFLDGRPPIATGDPERIEEYRTQVAALQQYYDRKLTCVTFLRPPSEAATQQHEHLRIAAKQIVNTAKLFADYVQRDVLKLHLHCLVSH